MTGDMLVRIEGFDCAVVVNVENVAYSGEVLRDMVNRALDGWQRAVAIAAEYEVVDGADADDTA